MREINELQDAIHTILIERAPNPIPEIWLFSNFSNQEHDNLNQAIDSLISKNIAKRENDLISLIDYSNLPIRRIIKVGDKVIPRNISNEIANAETVNLIAEQLNESIVESSLNIQKKFNNEFKKYWGSIITLFGVFVGLFSIINLFQTSSVTNICITPGNIFLNKFYEVLPLALILGLFTLLLWLLFSRRS